MVLVVLIFGGLLAPQPHAYADVLWAQGVGSIYDDEVAGLAATPDGGIVLAVNVRAPATFAAGTPDEVVAGGSPVQGILAKYDGDGGLDWVRVPDGTHGHLLHSVEASSQDGTILAAGTFAGQLTLGAGELSEVTLHAVDEYSNLYVAKYSSTGDLLWAYTGTPAWNANARDARFGDAEGNLVLGGIYFDRYAFPTDSGEVVLETEFMGSYLARLTSDGELDWAISEGSDANVSFRFVDANNAGSVYALGKQFRGETAFGVDTQAETTIATPENREAYFVAEYSAAGEFQSVTRILEAEIPSISGFAATDEGFVISGYLSHFAILLPDSDEPVTLASSTGPGSLLLAAFNSDGTLAWYRLEGGGGFEQCMGVDVDPVDGSLYTVGRYRKPATFGKGEPNEVTLTSPNTFWDEAYVAKYAPDGQFLWARSTSTNGPSMASEVAKSPTDSRLFVAGRFGYAVTFGDPWEPGYTTVDSLGGYDIFLAAYNSDPLTVPLGSAAILIMLGALGVIAAPPRWLWRRRSRRACLDSPEPGSARVSAMWRMCVRVGSWRLIRAQVTTLWSLGVGRDQLARLRRLLVMAVAIGLSAAGPRSHADVLWAQGVGSIYDDEVAGLAATPDGGVIMAVNVNAPATFAAGTPDEAVAGGGPVQGVLAKYDGDGGLDWLRVLDGTGSYMINSVAVAPGDGAIIVAGSFQGLMTFGVDQSNEQTLDSGGYLNFFLARYSQVGDFVWAYTGAGQYDASAFDVDVSSSGIVLCGFYYYSYSFPLASGSVVLETLESAAFVAEFTPDGELRWVHAEGVDSNVVVDYVGGSPDETRYLAGTIYNGEATFGAGTPYVTTITTPAFDIDGYFVAKYSPDGDFQSVWQVLQAEILWVSGFSATNDGFAVCGTAAPQVIVLPDSPTPFTIEDTDGSGKMFLAVFNSDGSLTWHRVFGSSGFEQCMDLTVDPADGSFYIVGRYRRPATFGEGEPNEVTLTSPNTFWDEAYVAKYAPDGQFLWARSTSTNGPSMASEVAKSPTDSRLFVAGRFGYAVTFGDPWEPGYTTVDSLGGYDIFLAAYNSDPLTVPLGSMTIWLTVGAVGVIVAPPLWLRRRRRSRRD